MDLETNEVFTFEDTQSQIEDNAENHVENKPEQLEEPPVNHMEIQSQLNISSGTQERFTPVKQPRFGKCAGCTKRNTEIKHEQAKVKRLQSARRSDQKKFHEETTKLKEAYLEEIRKLKVAYNDEHKMVFFLKGLHEEVKKECSLIREERDNLLKRWEETKKFMMN